MKGSLKRQLPIGSPGALAATIGNRDSELAGAGLLRRTGLAETGDAVAFLPLAALLQQGDAFKALQNTAFGTAGNTDAPKTVV